MEEKDNIDNTKKDRNLGKSKKNIYSGEESSGNEQMFSSPESKRSRENVNNKCDETSSCSEPVVEDNSPVGRVRRRLFEDLDGELSGGLGSPNGGGEYSGEEDREEYYTFILHKRNIGNFEQKKKSRGRGPSFVTFDHGDHLHILFGGRNGENVQGNESVLSLMHTLQDAQSQLLRAKELNILGNSYCIVSAGVREACLNLELKLKK